MPNSPTNMLQIPMVGGIDDDIDDRVMPLGNFSQLNNAVVTQAGSIQKRSGYGRINSNNPVRTGMAYDYKDRITIVSRGPAAYTEFWDGDVITWLDDQAGSVSSFSAQWGFIPGNIESDLSCKELGSVYIVNSVIMNTGYQGICWTGYRYASGAGTLGTYAYIKHPNGQFVMNGLPIPSGADGNAQAFNLNSKMVIVGGRSAGPSTFVTSIDTDSANFLGTATTTIAAIYNETCIDSNKISEDIVVVAYKTAAAQLTIKTVDCSGNTPTVAGTFTINTVDTVLMVAICGDRDTLNVLHVYWVTTAAGVLTCKVASFNSTTFAAGFAATTVFTGTVDPGFIYFDLAAEMNVVNNRSVFVFSDHYSFLSGATTMYKTTSTGTVYLIDTYSDGEATHKPFIDQFGGEFVFVKCDSISTTTGYPLSSTGVILSLGKGATTGLTYFAVGYFDVFSSCRKEGNANQNVRPMLPRPCVVSDYTGTYPTESIYWGSLGDGIRGNPDSIILQKGTGTISLHKAVFTLTDTTATEFADVLAFSSTILGQYDGRFVVNIGFVKAPITVYVSQAIVGSGLAAGTYKYRSSYEYVDAKGNIHRSILGPIITVVVAAGNTAVTVNMEMHPAAIKPFGGSTAYGACGVILYRTLAGGSVFYRTSPDNAINVANVKGTKLFTYVDNIDDTKLGLNPVSYEDLGELAPFAPPPPYQVIEGLNRVFLFSKEDPTRVWFSKEISTFGDFSYAPEFNPALTIDVGGASEYITALGILDEKLIIFTANKIFFVSGQGPNNAGTGAFNGPFQITSDVGCIDRQSIVVIPAGMFFRGKNGLNLLDRSLAVTFPGDAVKEHLNVQAPYNLIPVLDSKEQRVMWLEQDVGLGVSSYIVYDYDHKFWCTWSVNMTGGVNTYSHCMVNDKHIIQYTDILYEAGAGPHPGYDHDDDYPQLTIETPWIYVSAIGGYQRIRRLIVEGRANSYHYIVINVYYDYSNIASQTYSFIIQPATIAEYPVIRIQQELVVQKCQAMKIRINDVTYENLGQPAENPTGPNIFGISLETIAKEGRVKLPYQNRK